MFKKTPFSHSLKAKVIACHGRAYRIQNEENEVLNAVTRGKKSFLACGDEVLYQKIAPAQAVVETVLERKSVVFRSDATRQKLIAANCTQLLIVIAPEPFLSDDFLTRALIIAHTQNIKPLILLNKIDLPVEVTQERLLFYQNLNYPVVELCAIEDVSPLLSFLEGESSLLLGQSGVGKSSILNAVFGKNLRKTAPLSTALQQGVHTSTHTALYFYNAFSTLIDSPGLQQLGLAHLNVRQLEGAFLEFAPFLGKCRFRDCQHQNEPHCAILEALKNKHIPDFRYGIFQHLTREIPR